MHGRFIFHWRQRTGPRSKEWVSSGCDVWFEWIMISMLWSDLNQETRKTNTTKAKEAAEVLMFGGCYLFKPSSASSVFALNKGNINSGTLDAQYDPPSPLPLYCSWVLSGHVKSLDFGVWYSEVPPHQHSVHPHTVTAAEHSCSGALCVHWPFKSVHKSEMYNAARVCRSAERLTVHLQQRCSCPGRGCLTPGVYRSPFAHCDCRER